MHINVAMRRFSRINNVTECYAAIWHCFYSINLLHQNENIRNNARLTLMRTAALHFYNQCT